MRAFDEKLSGKLNGLRGSNYNSDKRCEAIMLTFDIMFEMRLQDTEYPNQLVPRLQNY